MDFKSLNLKNDYLTKSSILKIGEQQIEIKQYLPISDKNDLIAITLQKAEEDNNYNELLLQTYFHLNIIYLYTNIDFSEEDREDEMKLYDILETNGVIDNVVATIGSNEYLELKETLEKQVNKNLKYRNSAAAVIQRFIVDLPKNAAIAEEIVNNFNPEAYQQVKDFAQAANGGRNIITQMPTIQPPAQETQRKELKVQTAIKKD